MGNQGHSREGTRQVVEWINAGVIGPVREVHIWTDRPVRYWAQGIPRPAVSQVANAAAARPGTRPAVPSQWGVGTVNNAIQRAMADVTQPPPAGLDWDLYLGVAKEIPYHPAYHPFSWRGWVDFGVGAIGDMGAHLMDQAYWALGLTTPTSIVASSTMWGGGTVTRGVVQNPASYPLATTVQYEFGPRGSQPAVKMFWYDSGLLPPRPAMLPDDVPFPAGDGGGAMFVGDKGVLFHSTYGDNPEIHPKTIDAEARRIAATLPRITTSHEVNWANACKGEGTASSPFEYAAGLTEVMLLGIAALRAGPGRKILYDGPKMQITNVPEANQYLRREYRAGWSV